MSRPLTFLLALLPFLLVSSAAQRRKEDQPHEEIQPHEETQP